MKNKMLLFTLTFLAGVSFAQDGRTELELLWHSACESNADVLSAKALYEAALISAKTLDGIYAPSLSASVKTGIDEDYRRWDAPKSLSPSVSFSQPLPGGASLGVTGSYTLSSVREDNRQLVTQVPELTFSLSQSLLPFWVQGKRRNPEKLTLEQKKNYYYQQYLYTKQQQLQNVTRYYVLCLIYGKKMSVYEKAIALRQKQLDAYNELRKKGGANLAQVAEVETAIFNDRQNLYETRLTYEQYLQGLRNASAAEIEPSLTDSSQLPDTGDATYLFLLDNIKDPCALSLLANQESAEAVRVLNRQKNAPVMGLSLSMDFAMDAVEADDWRDAWSKDKDRSWTAGISFDLSPLFSSAVARTKKQDDINIHSATDAYNSYIRQKTYVRKSYEALLASFKEQLSTAVGVNEDAERLLFDFSRRYNSGSISEVEYDGYRFQALSSKENLECLRLYIWLYTWLLGTL